MPKIGEVTDAIKPYQALGLDIDRRNYGDQAICDCPFCDSPKFYVGMEEGQWDCKSCQQSGNIYNFMRLLWEKSYEQEQDYRELRTSRRLLQADTLHQWGVCRSSLSSEWLVPGYGTNGNLNQLYRLVTHPVTGKNHLYATPFKAGNNEHNHQLHGVPLYDPDSEVVLLCEGPWDGMALWEVLTLAKEKGIPTRIPFGNVLAAPGAGVFFDAWSSLFADKEVYLLYDNDHPVKAADNQPRLPGAGFMGMRRVSEILWSQEKPPKSIRYLCWGTEGYDENLPTGYDLRDAITSGKDIRARVNLADELATRIVEAPPQWQEAGVELAKSKKGEADIKPVVCKDWSKLIGTWKRAFKWTDGLDVSLSVMMASIVSTKAVGDQLWVRIISPASTGKSFLCEALSISKTMIKAVSTLRGFYSGYQSDKEGKADASLIMQVKDKTLVIKDGDTLLQSPNRDQILSELRDIYDRVSRSSFKNKMSRDYVGINLTIILCGTSSLRLLDTSELGERFLTCSIMDEVDPELEDEILWRVANDADQATRYEANGKRDTHYKPEMVKAMQHTGGYVEYLRQNANKLLSEVEIDDEAKRKCIALGKFVAYMRARPSSKQDEVAEREFSPRLVSQHIRLAKCLAVVLGKKEVDAEVLRRVTKVAMDTAKGRSLEVARSIYRAGPNGAEGRAIAIWVNEPENRTRDLLRFLRRINVVELYQKKLDSGLSTRPKWRLTAIVRHLYEEVMLRGARQER